MEKIIFLIILFISIDIIFIFLIFFRKKKLSKTLLKKINTHLKRISTLPLKNQILEYDKIIDLILKEKGYQGTLGEKMKSFKASEKLWKAHKFRNKLAHEIDFHPSKKSQQIAVEDFKKEIKNLL